ncbi:MAG: MAPEG family protein [Pseudomonadota bacterium]
MNGRLHVTLSALAGFVVIGLWFMVVPGLFTVDTNERLDFGLRWVAVLQIPMIAMILWISQQRFWSSDHADGSPPETGNSLEINRRVLTNTVEQTVLATVGLLVLSVAASADASNYVPALALLFVLGRFSFWLGYHINPFWRAFGLVLTLAPTLAVYFYVYVYVLGA